MITITMDNVYARIDGASKEIELMIWSELSFEVQEFQAEFSKKRHLYNRKSKKTYTGLVDYVFKILEENNEEYVVIDNRIKPEQNADFKLKDYLDFPNGDRVKLDFRPYQSDIVARATERECIQAATGA